MKGFVDKNLSWHPATVTREKREDQNRHRGAIIWFTGLSASGKSTIAHAIEERLHQRDIRTYVLDGDNVRHGLCSDLGFSVEDRNENIRRIGEMVRLFVDAGIITLAAFISPMALERAKVRSLFSKEDFTEVYCRCSIDVCEQRDVKGLYKKARTGELKEFTGISAPYEVPSNPDLVIDTDKLSLNECVDKILSMLDNKKALFRKKPDRTG